LGRIFGRTTPTLFVTPACLALLSKAEENVYPESSTCVKASGFPPALIESELRAHPSPFGLSSILKSSDLKGAHGRKRVEDGNDTKKLPCGSVYI